MRKRSVALVVAVLVLAAVTGLVVTLSMAAVKQYQWTGTVTDVDAKAKTMTVDKGGELWEFSTADLKDLKVKKGDKVTVYYVAVAKKVEAK